MDYIELALAQIIYPDMLGSLWVTRRLLLNAGHGQVMSIRRHVRSNNIN